MIYIASPYTHDDRLIRRARYAAALAYCVQCKRHGELVFSPIVQTHQVCEAGAAHDFAAWRLWCLSMLRRCDSVRVLQLPYWELSVGIRDELAAAAAMAMPIEYAPTPDDIQEAFADACALATMRAGRLDEPAAN